MAALTTNECIALALLQRRVTKRTAVAARIVHFCKKATGTSSSNADLLACLRSSTYIVATSMY
jgi:hypothetical protein